MPVNLSGIFALITGDDPKGSTFCMLDDPLLKERISELINQWNIAERRIKRAEQVRENEIVSTAIYELRYAGRKVMDAIYLYQNYGLNDTDTYNRIRAYVEDAIEDCVKAKHDAIDSMIDFVTTWLYEQEREIGLGKMQLFYPGYLSILTKIGNIQELVEESRGDRTKRRDSLYDEIENSGYSDVVNFYFQIRRSINRVAHDVNRQKIREICVVSVGIIEIFLAIVLIGIHFEATKEWIGHLH
jgi:hypothetical protein